MTSTGQQNDYSLITNRTIKRDSAILISVTSVFVPQTTRSETNNDLIRRGPLYMIDDQDVHRSVRAL